ncbi:unnamed protein product [Schistosoma intercalatum]|nr:unnamed protein product [Schistosoma intercalatum]
MNPSGHIVVIRRDGTDGLTCDWCSPLCDIGSNQSCDIRVQHSTVAPFHCTLQLLKDGLVQAVSRVDGRYKMLVNNFPLNDACVLTDNCILTVGDRQFRFFYPSSRKTTTDNYLYETSSKTPKHYNKEEVITPTSLPVVHPSKRTTPRKILVNPKTRSPRQRSVTPKRTLGTNERYGPVPPRQPATPPIIQVLRHEPNSSQSKQLPVLQAENVEFNKKSVGDGKGYSCTDVSVSKSNQTKSSVVPDLPDPTFHPSSSVLSSIKVRSQNRIHTPIITSTLSNDHFNFTPNENKRSPGFRKSFHKLLILNESSNQSNLCKINQFYDELSYVKQQVIESKRSPSNEQENQSCYDKCVDHPTEGSREYIPELPTSPNSLRIARKLSAKPSQKISIAYSPETEQELISRNRKRTISGKTYPVAEDMLAPKRRRGVSFGPPLSPERFDKSLPPSTPVKRGGTPLVKISHSTPANHSLQVTSVVGHSATPFDSKLSEVSHLSDFSKTCESPNYSVTHNRVSGVISLPPTPDTNLLNSLSTDISCAHESFASFPVTSAAYSAPIKKSSVSRKNFKRHSLGFLEKTSKTPSPRVPPTSPVSTKQNKKNKSTNEHNAKIQEKKSKSFHTYGAKTDNKNNYNKLYSSVPHSLLNITQEDKQNKVTSPVPPTNLTEEGAVTPEKSLLSPRKESGLTGVRKLMRTPKPVQTPRISGVSELFVDEPSVKRRRSRPSSVPSTNLTEEGAVTPEKSLLSPRKESGLTGVRKLMRTPKPVQTPRISGVSELFVDEPSVKRRRSRPSPVPPTNLTEEGAVTPEKSLLSPRKESGLTGVRKLMRTPKPVQTPRISGVSELFVDEPSVKSRRGRPSSVPPTNLTEEGAVTPEKSLLSPRKESGLTGVRKLMRTPKPVQTPRISGVSELFVDEPSVKRRRGRPSSVPPTNLTEEGAVTPEKSLLSPRKESGLTGVRKLMRTPKPVQTPRISGVSELFVDEPSVKRRRSRPSSVPPTNLTEEGAVTPEKSLLSPRKESGLTGVRKLMRTPKPVQTPRISGVSELFVDEPSVKSRRGRPSSVPPTNLTEEGAVTPEKSLLSPRKESGLTGVRKLMRTPKPVQTPRISGVSELFVDEPSVKRRRGRPSSVPPTNLTEEGAVTPEKSLLSPRKESGLTGVRKLMRTPKPVQTPRISGVSELFVDEPSVKRRRSRPSSVPPTNLTEEGAVTPEKSLLSPRKESGLTGVRKLMRTPKPVQTPRISGVSELFVDEPSVKRRRGRPSSVPPTNLTEEGAVTPEKSLLSPRKESGLTGVRKLMRTPKPVQTPRISGVSELFVDEPSVKRRRGRPSSVPPTNLTEEGAVTPEKSLLSPRKESGLTGVRKLMRTPKPVQTPRISGVSELFVDEPSVKSRRGRPSSVPPTNLTEEGAVTPEKSLLSPRKESGLTGVRKLMRTPKPVQTPRISGVSELFVDEPSVKRRRGRPSSVPPTNLTEEGAVTPEKSLLSPRKESGLTGVRKLMRTPKPVQTPRISGVSELFVDEPSVKSRRGRPSSVPPTNLTEEGAVTPEKSLLSPRKESGLTGVRKLMRTPKPVQTPRISGVSELFVDEPSVKRRRGRPSSVPPTNLTEEGAVTPEKSLLSPRKESGLTGVRKLMRTPKPVQTPRISGVSELFVDEPSVKSRRGRPSSVPPTNLTEEGAVTPEKRLLSPRKESGLTGVRKLMRTPKPVQTPRISGVSELFVDEPSVKRRRGRPSSVPSTNLTEEGAVTPEKSLLSPRKESGLTGVRKLMRTPKPVQTPRISGVSELFVDEPSVKRRRGRPSSVPPTNLTEEGAVTPEKSLLSPRKESGLTGVRKLMRTPKPVQTPRISGVSELFVDEPSVKRRRGRPSSVPPTNLTEEGAVTPEKSLLSPRKESGLTGVRKLMRTPKPVQTPRISGVSELFVEEPSFNVHCSSQKLSGVTSLSRRHCKSCRCLLSACECGFDFNHIVNKCSMRKCSDLVVESLSSIRTRRVVKIAKSSFDKSANSNCSILKKSPGKFTSHSTNEVTVQPSKTRSKTKRNVSTIDSQYPDSLSDRSMSVVKSLDKRMLKELTEVVVPFPKNVMENHSRKGKTLAFTSRLTPNNTSNSCDQSSLLKMGFIENSHPTVSFSSNTSKDRESDSVFPVASRLRNGRIPSSIECLSSSRTRRAVKAPDPLISESATKGSSGKSSVIKTSSRKVVSQSNNEVAIQPSKTRSKTKKNVSTMDSQFPDSLLNHSVNATKSANNTSKRSIKRLAEVRRVSSSIPLAKRLRSRIDQLDIKCITSEQTQNEEKSLPVKNQSGEEKKKNGTMTNNPRNRKQLITPKSKLLPTTSSSKSASTNESKNITTLKVNTNSRHIKRISVTPVDNIANVSPKRRVLRSRKLITTSSEISQPIEEKISTSKITNKSKLKTTTTNNNSRSVVSKSSQAKQSPVSIRQTRSRKKQTATNNL